MRHGRDGAFINGSTRFDAPGSSMPGRVAIGRDVVVSDAKGRRGPGFGEGRRDERRERHTRQGHGRGRRAGLIVRRFTVLRGSRNGPGSWYADGRRHFDGSRPPSGARFRDAGVARDPRVARPCEPRGRRSRWRTPGHSHQPRKEPPACHRINPEKCSLRLRPVSGGPLFAAGCAPARSSRLLRGTL